MTRASAKRLGVGAPEGLAVAVAEKPNWCRYHFPWDWKKAPWHILADITHSVGKGRATWIGISNTHVITDYRESLSRRGKNGQYWTVVEKRLLMSTCCFLIILSWWFFDIGIKLWLFTVFYRWDFTYDITKHKKPHEIGDAVLFSGTYWTSLWLKPQNKIETMYLTNDTTHVRHADISSNSLKEEGFAAVSFSFHYTTR